MTRATRILVETLLKCHEASIRATKPGPARDLLIAQYKAAAQTFNNARRRRKPGLRRFGYPAGSLGASTSVAQGSCVDSDRAHTIPV